MLKVKNNGTGFGLIDSSSGIGLKMIQSKIRLLKGWFSLTSENSNNNVVQIETPNESDWLNLISVKIKF